MNKIIKRSLILALLFAVTIGCYDDRSIWEKFDEVEQRLSNLEFTVSNLNKDMGSFTTIVEALQKNVSVTKLEQTSNGWRFTFSDGTVANIQNGDTPFVGDNGNWWVGATDTGVKAAGVDGITPRIGSNGNWWIGDTDTNVKAAGSDGITPHVGDNGNWWFDDEDSGVKAVGADGITPHIGSNGNWWFGNSDSGVKASGSDGVTPHVGDNGNWWIGNTDTGVKAAGTDGTNGLNGTDGKNGTDGITPHIGSNGNWWLGDTDTGVKAAGASEQSEASGVTIGVDKIDGVYYWTQTIDGETDWLRDDAGNPIPVNPSYKPVFKVVDKYLMYTIDGGVIWKYVYDTYGNRFEISMGRECHCIQFFRAVYTCGDYLVLVLMDGTTIYFRSCECKDKQNRGDIPEDPATNDVPDLGPDGPNIDIPYPTPLPTEPDDWGNYVDVIQFSGIQDPNTGEWLKLYGTGLTTQNIWIEVDGSSKGIQVINLEDNATGIKHDIVFTVDNSGSMKEEADAVASGIEDWMQLLSSKGVDVQFGFVGFGDGSGDEGIVGAMDMGSLADAQSFLNRSTGTGRTKGFAGSNASDLKIKAAGSAWRNSYGENGAQAVRFADESFSFRATASRTYINFTDEPNHTGGKSDFSVERFKDQTLWPVGNGTIHSVISDKSGIEKNESSNKELPWLMSEYTGGTTMFVKSDASDLDLSTLPVTDALTHSYTVKYIIPESYLDGKPHTIRVTIYANGGSVRGYLEFTKVYGTI